VHAIIGLRQRRWSNLIFAVNAASVAAVAGFELALMQAGTPVEYGTILRWMHLAIFATVVSLVLFVRAFFGAGRPWLAAAAIAARGTALLVNFLRRPNLNYVEITGLHRVPFLGEDVTVAVGTMSSWTRLGELASAVLLLFLLDATVTVWRRGEPRRADIVGGSTILFVLGAVAPTAFILRGIVALPYTISFAYLGIVAAMGYELTSEVLKASRLEGELRVADNRLALAADAASLGFWSWDVARDEVWMTPRGRALRGFGLEERLDSARFMSVVHAKDREGLRRVLEAALARRGEFDHEYRIVPPGGEVRWIALHGAAGPDPADGRLRVQGVSIDVSARKQAEEEARRRQNELAHLSRVTMLGELSGSLAHELNQPLTAILSNAQAAQRFLEKGEFDEIRDILADIVDEDRHAGEVIRRLRLLLRKGEVQFEPIEPAALVDDVVKLMRSDLVAHGVRMTTEIPGALPHVRGDRVQVQQVLVNLVSNACDAMSSREAEERLLTLSIHPDGPAVRVSVADAGCGLAAEEVERIFEPFVTTKSLGMGLGLTVCRTIVSAHGGRLWASNNDGPGATFHFTLPVAEVAER